MPEREVDLSELKKLLEQRVNEAEQRLSKSLQAELQNLSKQLSDLSQSLGRFKTKTEQDIAMLNKNDQSLKVLIDRIKQS